MYLGRLNRGTTVCGTFVGSSVAIGTLIFGKVLFFTGVFLLVEAALSGCSYRYFVYYCRNMNIAGGVLTGVGGVLIITGAVIYYKIRNNPIRNPALPVYNPPVPGTYPAPAYPAPLYQHPAPGVYPGTHLATQYYSPAQGQPVPSSYYPPVQGGLVSPYSYPQATVHTEANPYTKI